jgi:hypothetical protein
MLVTTIVPAIIAIVMFYAYMSSKVTISIWQNEISGYEKKTSALSDYLERHEAFQREKLWAKQCISETAEAIDRYPQWTDILITIVENMPQSLKLERLTVESQTVRVKVPDKKNPKKKVEISVPSRILNLTLTGIAGHEADKLVREYRGKLRTSPVLISKLEDIPVSQQMELVDGREIIQYEMKCIFKPQI